MIILIRRIIKLNHGFEIMATMFLSACSGVVIMIMTALPEVSV